MTTLIHIILIIVFIKLNLEAQNTSVYFQFCFFHGIYCQVLTIWKLSFSLLSEFIYLFLRKKRIKRIKCLYLVKQLEILLEFLFFCHVHLGLILLPEPLFFSTLFISTVPTRTISLGKNQRADLCSRNWEWEEVP